MTEMTGDQEALMNFMSELSEDYYSACWLIDLEYSLWAVLEGDKSTFAGGSLKDAEIQKLRDLSNKCAGWIYWSDESEDRGGQTWVKGETFMPLDEWKTRYEAWKAK
jgi:hypothetical protein